MTKIYVKQDGFEDLSQFLHVSKVDHDAAKYVIIRIFKIRPLYVTYMA